MRSKDTKVAISIKEWNSDEMQEKKCMKKSVVNVKKSSRRKREKI